MKLRNILHIILLERELTQMDLKQIEKYADMYFNKIGLDVEFTRHFLDRVNDERNKKQITALELMDMFKDTYQKYGKTLTLLPNQFNAVIKDMDTDINCPFVVSYDIKGNEVDLIMKTVMRKKDFRTSDKILKV